MIKTATLARLAVALVGLAMCAMPMAAHAQAANSLTERLKTLYLTHITAEICQIDMTEDQQTTLNVAIGDLEEKLKLSDEQADELFSAVNTQTEEIDTDQLCEKQSKWRKEYDVVMRTLKQ